MSVNQSQTTIALDQDDLEALIRRVVREELSQLLRTSIRTIFEDRQHEGPDDLASDDLLLAEALAVLQRYGANPEAWMSWEDFEAELDDAEAANELPH